MKIGAWILVAALLPLTVDAVASGVRVSGYTRKDGTYVAPHYRSSPNSSKLDNYSTRGNYNPYTGKIGTVDPYATPSYSPSRYTPPAYTPPSAPYPSPRPSVPSTVGAAALGTQSLPIGYQQMLGRPLRQSSDGVVPEPITGATTTSNEDQKIAAAMQLVAALGQRYRATDPNFAAKFAMLQPQIELIQSAMPPEQWVGAIEAAWSRLTPAVMAVASRAPFVSYDSDECQEASAKAQDLIDAATNLARCASREDFSDDCGRQARDARYAADDYASAVSAIDGRCR